MAIENPIYRRWNPPVATRLPEIHGWLQDVRSAHEFVSRLHLEWNSGSKDFILLDALLTTALVRYSRCFTTGIRKRLSIEELDTASIADIELHEKLLGIRDWHIAHPVNEQEVHAMYVILDGSPNAKTGAVGFSSFSAAESPLNLLEVSTMLELCEKWIACLNTQLINEETLLIPLVNTLSRDELIALPQDEPQPNSNIKARRRQGRK